MKMSRAAPQSTWSLADGPIKGSKDLTPPKAMKSLCTSVCLRSRFRICSASLIAFTVGRNGGEYHS